MKKQSNLSRLMEYAGGHRYLTYASWILSAVSALLALVPYYYIWLVMKEVLEVNPDFDKAQNLAHNGWMAVIFAVIAVLIYIRAHVLTYGSFQGRYEYEDRYDGTYSQAPVGVCGVFRQRESSGR